MLLMASAALITIAPMSANARDRDRDRPEQTSNQIVNEADAQTARIKVDLRLTPEQEKNWPGFESAMHDMSKRRADRVMAMREERNKDADKSTTDKSDKSTTDKTTTGSAAPDRFNLIDQINRDADARIERANDWKTLSKAAKPLYDSLDDQQKRRFADVLLQGGRHRDRNFDRDGERGGYRDSDRDRD
ncbi:Spy/CpxP family protein refolding chaperone [Rhodopseudomonas sp.]|uniref:Spy/CpxP family protein refolding chaperone n=1 Tax=Rhodopseudomonas sp. TaxID=1078 RepID=UPI0025FFF967|nr:Spy/CpxP family protein refolding chaperone [Rhodopseudomonas sp.]